VQSQPFIVTIVPKPAQEVSLRDVIVNAIGVTGALTLIALVLGAIVALVLIRWHKRHPPEIDHLPSVSPFSQRPDAPPTSQAQ
jgi:Kef-type K+ transport system membrane component KefB